MEKRDLPLQRKSGPSASVSFEAALLAALMALVGIGLFARPVDHGDEVTITGWLLADQHSLSDAVLVVEVNASQCLESTLQPSGRFEFKVPVGAKARLIFEKPGYKTKEVLVDTRNALNTAQARRANKNVKFSVELESLEERKDEAYIGPVGYIHFVNGSGMMRVRHDERTVPILASPDQSPAIVQE